MTYLFKPSCRDVTALVLQRHDRTLQWHERLAIRVHWTMCKGCRNLGRQAELMHEAMARWRTYRTPD